MRYQFFASSIYYKGNLRKANYSNPAKTTADAKPQAKSAAAEAAKFFGEMRTAGKRDTEERAAANEARKNNAARNACEVQITKDSGDNSEIPKDEPMPRSGEIDFSSANHYPEPIVLPPQVGRMKTVAMMAKPSVWGNVGVSPVDFVAEEKKSGASEADLLSARAGNGWFSSLFAAAGSQNAGVVRPADFPTTTNVTLKSRGAREAAESTV